MPLRQPAPGVRHGQPDGVRIQAGAQAEATLSGRDLGHGIAGVGDEVEQRLFQGDAIPVDRRQPGVEVGLDPDAAGGQVAAEEAEDGLDEGVGGEGLAVRFAALEEGAQALDDLAGAAVGASVDGATSGPNCSSFCGTVRRKSPFRTVTPWRSKNSRIRIATFRPLSSLSRNSAAVNSRPKPWAMPIISATTGRRKYWSWAISTTRPILATRRIRRRTSTSGVS